MVILRCSLTTYLGLLDIDIMDEWRVIQGRASGVNCWNHGISTYHIDVSVTGLQKDKGTSILLSYSKDTPSLSVLSFTSSTSLSNILESNES